MIHVNLLKDVCNSNGAIGRQWEPATRAPLVPTKSLGELSIEEAQALLSRGAAQYPGSLKSVSAVHARRWFNHRPWHMPCDIMTSLHLPDGRVVRQCDEVQIRFAPGDISIIRHATYHKEKP